jgi:phospholipid/cholesterol/gamma-HCH transport system substrate-binding protein
MVTKAQRIRLGIFIAIGSVLILAFAGVVAGSRLLQRRDIYYVQYEDVSVNGLQVGGTVNYHGIKVGRVDTIKLNPKDVSKVILTISVDAGTPIRADVEATLVPVGITGLKSVELRGGSNQAALVKPKSFLKVGTSSFDDITGRAVSIAEKIDLIASNISNLTNNKNQENIAKILSETSLLLSDTRANLGETLHSLSIIAANAAEVASSASTNLTKLTENVNQNLTLVSQSSVKNMDKIVNTTTQQIDSLGINLNASVRELNRNSNLLLSDARLRVNSVGDHTDQLIVQTSKDITEMTNSINSTLKRINQMAYSAPFDSLIVNANAVTKKLAAADLVQLVKDLDVTVSKTSSMIANVDRTVTRGRTDLLQTLEDLREAAENLNEFSRQIAENPSVLILGNK